MDRRSFKALTAARRWLPRSRSTPISMASFRSRSAAAGRMQRSPRKRSSARTYALSHRVTGRDYDLVANTADQVWGGVDSESPQTNAAVDATKGELVTYAGGLASVFYSASCGGHTADASDLWGGANLPYLRGVADPYCVVSLSVQPLDRDHDRRRRACRFGPGGRCLGTIQSIGLEPPPADLRPGLRITGSLGTASSQQRAMLAGCWDPTLMRSSLWHNLTILGDPTQASTGLRIEGSGSGHGVGLCQWGARVMAQQGALQERS